MYVCVYVIQDVFSVGSSSVCEWVSGRERERGVLYLMQWVRND